VHRLQKKIEVVSKPHLEPNLSRQRPAGQVRREKRLILIAKLPIAEAGDQMVIDNAAGL
jgi:hypothetical protein